ncbi:sensor histidine kinase [Corynebacterium sp.]|uniref:sensor histidine kinase n=1 Tax=Corynebacterium sp. TaxID=1720 RepID=UPI0026DF7CD6|nr:histidine kinase [Corynebacterium sp.]MDO5512217.1 histidine kinase [Corynebacterium sp.]
MTSTPRALPHPVRSWRGLDSATKFLLYTRWSLQSVVLFLPLFFLFPAAGIDSITAWGMALLILLVGSAVVVSVIALELQPSLNLAPRRDHRPWFTAGLIGLTMALAASIILYLVPVAAGVTSASIFLAISLSQCLSMAYLPFVAGRWWWVLLLTIVLVLTFADGLGSDPAVGYLIVLPAVLTSVTIMSLWTAGVMRASERARHLEAELKVSEERVRFAQELHDTLGQHLAAMSIKAELAQKLAERGDVRLTQELADLRELTSTSLSEMREVVQGYRSVNLATEVAGARSLLLDARIPLTVTGDSLEVPAAHREQAAWFVREATTNLLRHSDATAATLTLGSTAVTMHNDGVQGDVGKPGGLDALRRRGARVETAREADTFTATLILGEQP